MAFILAFANGSKYFWGSLEPITSPNLFDELKLKQKLNHHVIDITNQKLLEKLILEFQLISFSVTQPLVIESYKEPLKTWKQM